MDKSNDEHKINEIVENLTSKLYFHGHPINRKEADEDLGLKISKSNAAIEEIMWKLISNMKQRCYWIPFRFVDDFVAKYPELTPVKFRLIDCLHTKGFILKAPKERMYLQ